MLSHFPNENRSIFVNQIFDDIISYILPFRVPNSPFLIIINDIDHWEIRQYFDSFIEKLSKAGYGRTRAYYHFKDRNFEANDGSARHELNGNLFVIPEEYKKKFHCAIVCTGAQAIIEVKPK